jgi:predicted secreted protein
MTNTYIQITHSEILGKIAYLDEKERNPFADEKMKELLIDRENKDKEKMLTAWEKGWDIFHSIFMRERVGKKNANI